MRSMRFPPFCRRNLIGRATQALLLVASPALAAPAFAAEVIGAAESISNRVTGELRGTRRMLAEDADVHRNELIRTEAEAAARLRFVDRSDLRLGPQAQIRLDAFVFSGKSGSAMNLTRGALRFVSGNGPTGSYQIRTPVATIGLRGTGVDIVLRQGRVFVTLLEGEARVCAPSGQCTELVNRCDYVEAGGGRVQPARALTASVPTFNSACVDPGCGGPVCISNASPSRSELQGPDPAAGSGSGAGGGGTGGGGGGGGGTGR